MSPFNWRTVLLAKHAQHVSLIHFPIALFIIAAALDVIGYWLERRDFATVAYFNFTIAALAALPAALTGVLAWQWQLEGQHLKGVLLFHVLAALGSTAIIGMTWWIHYRARIKSENSLPTWRLLLECVGIVLLGLTGHLGGFLSGVNS